MKEKEQNTRPEAWLDYDSTDRPNERWKTIKGYPNYEASTHGRVRSIRTKKILKPQDHPGGYLHVRLFKNGQGKTILLHRLIMDSFSVNLLEVSDVNHKDLNKKNCSLDNLEYASRRENNLYMRDYKKPISVDAYDLDGNFIGSYSCECEAARCLGVFQASISQNLRGLCSRAGNYRFKVSEDASTVKDILSVPLF